MAVEAQIIQDHYSKQPHMVSSWDSISTLLYRWTITIELRYVVSRPSTEQLSLVRVEFESVSGHPATDIHNALLKPSGCHGDVFTAAMQVQPRGKRVKSGKQQLTNLLYGQATSTS